MKIKTSLVIASILLTSLVSADEVKSDLENYLSSIKIDGAVRIANVKYDHKNSTDTYSTGIGGFVKLKLPIYKENVSFDIAPYFGKSLSSLSGNEDEYETSLTSKDKDFMNIGEANLNINYNDFGLVIGRQIINTPLMGDDDLRLTNQSFEGLMASYNLENTSFYAGYFTKWQGFDAGLLNIENKKFYEFQKMGTKDSDGTVILGMEHNKTYSFSEVAARTYYYSIDKYSNVAYVDVNFNNKINDDISTDVAFQYSKQIEQNDSNVEGELYGIFAGLSYDKLYLSTAYTQSKLDENNTLFNGFGGEFYFTAMNEWAMGYLSAGEDEDATSFGLSYDLNDSFNMSMYTTTFKTQSDKVQENDIFLTYSFNERLTGELMYANVKDKKDDNNSYDNFIYRLTLTF